MATPHATRDWQDFYKAHPTPDPHQLSGVLFAARKSSASASLPVKVGVANALVLVAGIIAVAAN